MAVGGVPDYHWDPLPHWGALACHLVPLDYYWVPLDCYWELLDGCLKLLDSYLQGLGVATLGL